MKAETAPQDKPAASAVREQVDRFVTWVANGKICPRCRNRGTVLGHRPTIYCTDSDDEIEDAYRMAERRCPECPDFEWVARRLSTWEEMP